MPDEDLRELERCWAEGRGDLAAGEAFSRALERAGADTGRRLEVRLQVLRGHLRAAGLGHLTLGPQPELDPMAASFLIPGEEAFRAWHALRARTEASGAYPVIVGSEQQVELMLEAIHDRPELTPTAIIERASRPEASAITSTRGLDLERWPDDVEPLTEPTITLDPTGRERVVRLALLPTRTPWHAAAYLRFGQVTSLLADEFPLSPEDHVAQHRSWFERFEAAPLAVSIDLVEFVVGRPPATRDEAVRLWSEHHGAYPVTGPINDAPEWYAARLIGGTVWTLWS